MQAEKLGVVYHSSSHCYWYMYMYIGIGSVDISIARAEKMLIWMVWRHTCQPSQIFIDSILTSWMKNLRESIAIEAEDEPLLVCSELQEEPPTATEIPVISLWSSKHRDWGWQVCEEDRGAGGYICKTALKVLHGIHQSCKIVTHVRESSATPLGYISTQLVVAQPQG